jgi:metallophosphoesterase (TIGR00282 family)
LKILFIGDIIGRPGRQLIRDLLPRLVDQHMIDLVIANGENAAAGFGLTPDVVSELFDLGVDVLTTGNHVWDKRDGLVCLDQEPALLRPANYPEGAPGRGLGLYETAAGISVAVVNLEGRVFMNGLDCPFRKADAILDELGAEQRIVFVDFHAEATSEKVPSVLILTVGSALWSVLILMFRLLMRESCPEALPLLVMPVCLARVIQ